MLKTIAISVLATVGAAQRIPTPRAQIAAALDAHMLVPWSVQVGRPYHWGTCRRAPAGCSVRIDTFADYFADAAHAHGVDPWTLAAMASRETSLNPAAEGRAGERSIMQLTRRSAGASLRWMWDDKRMTRCLREVGACQRDAVMRAAAILAKGLEACGTEFAALGRYNSGSCGRGTAYARRVLKRRALLMALAGGEA